MANKKAHDKWEMANNDFQISGILVLLCTSAFTTLAIDNLLFSIILIAACVDLSVLHSRVQQAPRSGAAGTANGN